MYAHLLGAGCNLMCRALKCETIKGYIKDIATFLILFSQESRDYRFESPNATKMSPTLHQVFAELKTWDDMPNRREPYTIGMLANQQQWTVDGGFGPDSAEAALVDWFEAGLFARFRLTEYAQEKSKHDPEFPKLNLQNETAAFCMNDVRAQIKRRQAHFRRCHP